MTTLVNAIVLSRVCLRLMDAADVPPLREHVEDNARQSRPRRPIAVLCPLGLEQADRHRANDQRRSDPADDSCNPIQHGRLIHATARCRPTARSGTTRTR